MEKALQYIICCVQSTFSFFPSVNTIKLYWQVDDNLFRVPQHIFTEPSSTFTTMHSLPPEGEEDNNPVVLRDVDADDFRSFLKCALKTFSDDEGTDVWLSAIKVADLWHLTRVRSFALSKLEQSETDLGTRIELSRTHNIHEWFRPTMLKLALRKKAPVKREAEQIGWENTVLLFQLRERLCPLRRSTMEKAMMSASNGQPDEYTCPFCRAKITGWSWVDVSDKTEALEAKKAITEAFESDLDGPRTYRKGHIDTQPLQRSPPSSIRRGAAATGAAVGVTAAAATSYASSGCCSDCC